MNSEIKRFARYAVPFVLVGLVLYAGLYAASEQLIRAHARRNRFYMVKTAPLARYDYVILGASHAAAFDYEDMNARLEAMTGSGSGCTISKSATWAAGSLSVVGLFQLLDVDLVHLKHCLHDQA